MHLPNYKHEEEKLLLLWTKLALTLMNSLKTGSNANKQMRQ